MMLMRMPAPKPLLGWPSDRPEPTEEEFWQAEKRYFKSCSLESESYWNMGLRYVMATYDRLLWMGFFFPDEEDDFRKQYEACKHYVEKCQFTADKLIEFEKEVAAEFEAGKIAAPVHLAGGNEQQLIDIFRGVGKDDWVLVSWRAHYHCLLKGVPPDELKDAIRRGRSIGLCFPKHKVLCSAIVGGICPIAVGIAMGIKIRGGRESVHCFVGDMTSECGIFHECTKYAVRHQLPVNWIVEDNGKSVMTDTQAAWGAFSRIPEVMGYKYSLTWPHVGIGKFVQF